MATAVFFHAHPDDESITTGGTMARAAAAGHRVVLVVATDGRHGESPNDLRPDETLVARRQVETARSAAALGVAAVVHLGYEDSGMHGWAQNHEPGAFLQASTDDAGARLASILRAEAAAVLVTYDWHGNYGHPDHVKVHHVGHRAAEMAGTPIVYEATMNRDLVEQYIESIKEEGGTIDVPETGDDGNPLGTPEAEITTAVDVSEFVDAKRASIAAHASQETDTTFFLEMPIDTFRTAFGKEWFIRVGAPPGIHESWLAGLD
jgi:LmbE family N-acetylglucosaminyl deacetylase